jgi:hypothetical protein
MSQVVEKFVLEVQQMVEDLDGNFADEAVLAKELLMVA